MPKTNWSGRGGGRHPEDDRSYLVDETKQMARMRREMEQDDLRIRTGAKVHTREHSLDDAPTAGDFLDATYGEEVEAHPLLDSQLLDGVDVNPADPNLDPEAKRKIENKKRDQEHDKQLRLTKRLELQNTYTPTFNPKPGGGMG